MNRVLFVLLSLAIIFDGYAFVHTRPLPLPRHLTINGEPWTVTPAAVVENGLLGETYCDTRTIAIARGLSPADNAEVVLHESLHALTCLGGGNTQNWLYNNTAEAHPGIYWAAPHIVGLLVQNPDLNAYVMRYGRGLTFIEAGTAGGAGGELSTPFIVGAGVTINSIAGPTVAPPQSAPPKDGRLRR